MLLKRFLPLLIIILFMCSCGCSGSGDPVTSSQVPFTDNESNPATVGLQSGNHYLWSYHLVYIDPTDPEGVRIDVVPVRQVATHWNALSWLQDQPCSDCFKLVGITPIGPGKISADVEITHPFDNLNLTGFDVRGIPMFDASYTFDESGLTVSDSQLGDGELLNADGYTTLYNATTAGSGPNGLQGYIKGKLATLQAPNALLNGYKRHISEGYNPRNIFNAGEAVTATYEIDMPDGPFVFGYAVDASWAKAESLPVYDPAADFGLDANCSEPWKLEFTEEKTGNGLLPSGGATKLVIDVYDHQGFTTHANPVIECSGLFDGTKSASLVEYGDGYTRYDLTITNENTAPAGWYKILFSVEDNDNAGSPEWLDLTAYGMITLRVTPVFNFTEITPDGLNWAPTKIVADGDLMCSASYNLGFNIFDVSDSSSPAWAEVVDDIFGNFTVNDGFAYTLEHPDPFLFTLHIIDIDPPSSAAEVAVMDMPLSVWCSDIQVLGNYAYIAGRDQETETHLMKIVDVSDPTTASIVNSVALSVTVQDLCLSDGYAYVTVSDWNTEDDYLQIVDVDPPESAYVVTTLDLPDLQYNQPGDVRYYQGYVVVANGDEGMHIIDVDPPETAFAMDPYIPTGYYVKGLDIEDQYAYICGLEDHHILQMW